MKMSLLIFVLIFSLLPCGISQTKLLSTGDDVFKDFTENPLDSNEELYKRYIETITSKKYLRRTKAELTSRLLAFHLNNGNYLQFHEIYNKHNEVLEENSILFQYWNSISLERNEKFIAMLSKSEKLLYTAEEYGNNQDISDAYRLLSRSKMHLNEKDSALFYSNLALNFAKRSNSKTAVAQTFKDLSEVYIHFNMIGQSTSTLLKLTTEAERIKEKELYCWSTMKIAERSAQVKSYNEARAYYRKALDISNKNDLTLFKIRIHRGLAEVALSLNDLNKAKANLMIGSKLIKDKHESIYVLDFKLTLANFLIEEKKYEEAEQVLQFTLKRFETHHFSNGTGRAYHVLGKLHFYKNEWGKAEEAFKNSKKILEKYPFSTSRMGNLKYLSDLFAQKKKYGEAYRNLRDYQKNIDENSSLSSIKAINELTQMYSRELREYRIKEQEQVIKDQIKEKEFLALKGEKQMSTVVLMIIVLISTIVIILFYLRQIKIKQTTKEVEMSQTLLRTQMNPHFIFNAMSVIQSSLYENNPAKSSKFLVSFSRLIRLILENSPKEFITLETEIEILEKYLNTQKLRFENRFNYQINAPEELIFKKVLIPPMITQPFVENSIEHGQLNIIEDGNISIDFKEVDNMLFVEIRDNGVGREQSRKTKKSMKDHKSMAIDITNRRVDIINKKHKSKASIEISNLTQGKHSGTRVQIFLPLLTENINFDTE
tara:strand:+ start:8758 stop:10896 length:2139 start_codon:yes stop_codon:yes gene_type:complete